MQRSQVLAEQRKHPRAHLRFPARIRWHGPLSMRFEIAEIIDVSREGVLLAWRGDLPATMARCWIVFPFDPSASGALEPETPARIARIEGDPGGGHRVGLELQPRKRSARPPIQPERRGFARVAVCLPVFVRSKGMPWSEEAMTRDFSRSGLRFETSDVYATGDGIRAEIPWAEWAEGGELFGRVETAEDKAATDRWGTVRAGVQAQTRASPAWPSNGSTRILEQPETFMADVFHRNFFLNGPAGRLEALLWTTSNPHPSFTALVCHPHPLFGGTMHNKVVYQAAKALHQCGAPVLRFNFRGAGQSEGLHDEGRGERDDVRAALDYLAAEFPALPILLAGFSFGSSVGLRVGCRDARVKELIGLGLPVDNVDMTFLQSCEKPKLILQGGNDQFGARAKLEGLYVALPEPKQMIIFDGADHFFAGALPKVSEAIEAWVAERHPAPGATLAP